MTSVYGEFDLSATEGVPNTPVPTKWQAHSVAAATNSAATKRMSPIRRRLLAMRNLTALAVAVLFALVCVRALLRFHSEYNILAESHREGSEYWYTVCNEGRTRPPSSYDQCTRAKTIAHQFTSLLTLERVLHLALQDVNPFADCTPGTTCAFVWAKASEALIRIMDSLASNLTLVLGLLSYVSYSNIGPGLLSWLRDALHRSKPPAA